jgi:hypothetical protein
MSEPTQLKRFERLMIRQYYGKRSPQWIGDRLGCSVSTVRGYAEQLGLNQSAAGERTNRNPFIPPPSREQLMAGSANLRRVYKVEA